MICGARVFSRSIFPTAHGRVGGPTDGLATHVKHLRILAELSTVIDRSRKIADPIAIGVHPPIAAREFVPERNFGLCAAVRAIIREGAAENPIIVGLDK